MTTHSHIDNPCKICGNEVAEIKQGIMASEPHIIGGALIKQYDRMIQLTGRMLLCKLPNDPDDLEDLIKNWAHELRQIANEILKEHRR